MVSRAGKKELWKMANGNESWLDVATISNIDKIYTFLESKSTPNNRIKSFSYAAIARATNIKPAQVSFACNKMAYKVNPYFRIKASTIRSKTGVRITERVMLVRFAQEE